MSTASTNSCNKVSKEKLLREIQELEFVAVELTLYLDMYPTDKRAVCQYNMVSEKMNRLKTQYQMEFGPLYSFGEFPSKYPWEWVRTPWPWEL
ncbi:spore coat protein CotJB [Desulfuribacillus stibiiarsenatis]|uniref:Spore coat protein CotJB n=1 Tax=Desulfuribacillus stibiiarsenatis TaxID=1390249 RepID=A0A1E5L822_9FIRM|nr:spore coat protein CotJB [Desulfuribacillus stibiiarsenatis]OEH86208.1 spore coat protein CotJB [Desulfuribacillus stibiiarsenatis]